MAAALSVAFLWTSACAALGVAGLLLSAPRPESADKTSSELYLANCATCHGETGDGKGITVLERPARSFKDGGFSYGNTPEALLRTITHGIPGSLMPSFKDVLGDEQRRALASYVIGLGPPVVEVDARDTVIVVRDRAVVARGKLPPIVEGAPDRPRGLLVGLPSGLSFEYRVDDVRLLGVRSGEFVDRRDWVGRGGDYLRPLGRLVRSMAPDEASFLVESNDEHGSRTLRPLEAHLVYTAVHGARVELAYDLVVIDGALLARVRETLESIVTPLGPGWKRSFELEKRRESVIAFRGSSSDAILRRLDARTAFACRSVGLKLGFDVTIARGTRGGAVSESTTVLEDVLSLLLESGDPAWTLYEVPGAALPEDVPDRIRAIAECARGLR